MRQIITYLIVSAAAITARAITSGGEPVFLDAPVELHASAVMRPLTPEPGATLTVEARAAMTRVKEVAGKSPTWWAVVMTDGQDSVSVSLRMANSNYGDFTDRRTALLTVSRADSTLLDTEVSGFKTGRDGYNTLKITLTPSGAMSISGGAELIKPIAELSVDKIIIPEKAGVWSNGDARVTVLTTFQSLPPEISLASGYTKEMLDERFSATTDPLEGYWAYFDRVNDPTYSRPGGRYRLAVVRRENADIPHGNISLPVYDIVYVDGAEIMPDSWHPMMLKGRITGTIFEGQYDIEWIDSTLQPHNQDLNASLSDGSLLTLSFPLLKATLRFSKVPM
ncbi:MAG: hypothetical protein K2K92_06665 [Duncaniella sp.]|nr:hypothetical protein [Duncaniella sp.]